MMSRCQPWQRDIIFFVEWGLRSWRCWCKVVPMMNTETGQPLTIDEILANLDRFERECVARGLDYCTPDCPRCECEDVLPSGPCAHCRMH